MKANELAVGNPPADQARMSVAKQIKAARIASGLSRTEWGKAIGISRPNTYRIEKEGYNCKLNVLKNVTKLLQITICISSET